ncbi:MAG: PAS domain S-box protein, partial [Sedimentisphaerales bacterium]
MGNVDRSSEPLRKLRGRAEQKAGRNIQALRKQQPTEKDELLHKLRVHQVELEMQNEELRRARLESETLRQKYFDLFDLAPMGYFTLDRDGRILEANLAGTALLGTTKSQSLKKNLSLWVSRDYQDAFYLHRREAADSKMSCTCELKLRRSDDSEFIAQMVSWAEMDDEGHFEKLRTAVLDISERKRIEEAMRESEARLSEAMKIAKLGYWEYDATDDVFTFDDQFYSVYRTSAEKVGGYRIPARRYAELFLHPDDVPQLREEIQKATETSDPDFCGEGEHRFIYGDGRIGYVSVRYFVVKDSQGRTVKTCGVNQDITERKRAEESLRASENRLSEGAKLAKLGYWEHDVLNELFTFSDHFYEVLRTTADEVGGYEMSCNQYFETFVHPDDRERVKAKCHDVFENPDSQSGHYLEHRIIYADGEIGRIAVRFSRVKDDQGRVIRTYGVNQDITERRRAEEAYRSLVDHSLQGLVIFQEGHVVFANEAMTKITGYTIDEMLAMSPDEVQTFVHPEDREMVWERHAQRLNGNPLSQRYELRGIRKDGSVRWLKIDASLVEYQGKRAIQAAYVDITERKQIEEAIKTSEVRYRELFDHMSSGVAVFASRDEGEDFVFLDFNEAGEQIDAIKKEDVIGKSVVDVFPRIREFDLFDVLRNVWKTGVPQHHPVSLYKDARLVGWRENYVYKLPSGEIVAVYRDLTERMRAENALRESEAQLRRAQEVAHMGSWYLDLATDRLTWSDETYRIFEKPVGRPITKEDCQASVHPDDLAHVMESWTKALYAGQYDNEHRIVVGEIVKWVREKAEIEFDRDGEPVSAIGTVQDITERVVAEQERLAHVRFLESMARIDRAIRGTNRLEEMMSNVLGEVLDILECDRAFFVYPCDPDSPTWSVPMERTRPQHPGIAPSTKMRTEDETAEVMRILLAADGPVKFGPGSEHLLASRTAEQFGQQSMIGMALYPKTGGPWAFGLHQCSYPRVWTTEEERLFQEIGRRLADGLTSLLMLRSLRESEGRLAEAQSVAHLGYWEYDIVTDRITWSDETYRIFGLGPKDRILNLLQLEERVHPEDRS